MQRAILSTNTRKTSAKDAVFKKKLMLPHPGPLHRQPIPTSAHTLMMVVRATITLIDMISLKTIPVAAVMMTKIPITMVETLDQSRIIRTIRPPSRPVQVLSHLSPTRTGTRRHRPSTHMPPPAPLPLIPLLVGRHSTRARVRLQCTNRVLRTQTDIHRRHLRLFPRGEEVIRNIMGMENEIRIVILPRELARERNGTLRGGAPLRECLVWRREVGREQGSPVRV